MPVSLPLKSKVMGIAIVAAVVAVPILYTLLKTAKTASHLMYDITKVQVYKVDSSGIRFRVFFSFTNPGTVNVTAQYVYLNILLDNSQIAQVRKSTPLTIKPGISTISVDVTISWLHLLATSARKLKEYFVTHTLTPPKKCVVNGYVKAENVQIAISQSVDFS